MEEPYRRRLFWHGSLILLVALLPGFPTTLSSRGRLWMAAHVTALIGALLVMGVAAAWSALRLSEGQPRRAFLALLVGVYANQAMNVLGVRVGFPGPATQPGVEAPTWQYAVFGVFAAVLIPALLIAVGTVLRGPAPRAPMSTGSPGDLLARPADPVAC
jgi:hypothetical protein